MLKILVDENCDNTIVRGLFRRNPTLDIVRVQDVGLSGKDGPDVLEWAAQEGRVLLTHDVATITRSMPTIESGKVSSCQERSKSAQMLQLVGSLRMFLYW